MEHHGAGLQRLTKNPALVAQLKIDYQAADLTPADRAMLDYATTLTRRPAAVTETDIAALRREGFDDGAIHEICAVTAYFAFVTRIADGLGVELEEDKRFPVRGLG